jgi:hypothetical protein
VRVVSDDEQRLAVRGGRHQVGDGHGHPGPARYFPGAPAEGGEQRVPLPARQLADLAVQRTEQLVQPGEREPGLRGYAGRGQDREPVLAGDRPGQVGQRCLPDTRITGDDQGTAALGGGRDQVPDDTRLTIAPEQHSRVARVHAFR